MAFSSLRKWVSGSRSVTCDRRHRRHRRRLDRHHHRRRRLGSQRHHERPFDFDPGPMRWDSGPRRFWGGTPAIPSYLAARPGYEIVAGIGVEAIREKSLRLTGRMIAWADEYGWRLGSPRAPEQRGGTVCLDVPEAERVCNALLASDVLLDHRPGVGLRLAPHFYTREDEVYRVMERVRDEVTRATA
jgi:kynureninase